MACQKKFQEGEIFSSSKQNEALSAQRLILSGKLYVNDGTIYLKVQSPIHNFCFSLLLLNKLLLHFEGLNFYKHILFVIK